MKSEINICCKNVPTLTFPRLMQSKTSGAIFLVTKVTDDNRFEGTVVNGVTGGDKRTGFHNIFHSYHLLVDYNGTVTLSND